MTRKAYWLSDKTFTAARRKELASKGAAMPDGSFPIESATDVQHAVDDWGRAGSDAAVKAHIIKRAQALGATDKLPADWTGSSKDAGADCPKCDGTGKIDGKPCAACSGSGTMDGSVCDTCDGEGTLEDGTDCPDCGGDGYMADSHHVMSDAFVLDGVRRTGDGYLTAFAKVARTGIQVYKGAELGRPDLDKVRVYRPPAEVFHADAMRSFTHRPITFTHPKSMVNAKNWKQFAGGFTGDEVVRDGEFVRVPMMVADQKFIDAIEGGTKELSMGYSCDLKWKQGVTDSGENYDAVQTAIRANHLAIVPNARGGKELRVGDGKTRKENRPMKTILVDGISVEVEDRDAQIIQKKFATDEAAIAELKTKVTALTTDAATAKAATDKQVADLTTAVGAKDGEIAVLKKAVEDGKVSPQKLHDMVQQLQLVIDAATPYLPKGYDTKAKDADTIRKDAVLAHLGDAAKNMDVAQINGAFVAMTKDHKPGTGGTHARDMGTALNGNRQTPYVQDADREKAFDEMVKRNEEAWKTKPMAAA
jgi:hypothetical protein